MVLESIKGLKGILYKKMVEKKETQEILPEFSLQEPKKLVEFPKIEDITKVSIIYPLIEPFAYANIKWDPQLKELIYSLVEPNLTEKEVDHIRKISEGLIDLIDVEMTAIKDPSKVINYLEEQVKKVMRELGISLEANQYGKIMYYIYRNFIGYNRIEPLLQDPNIEDISCDGVATPLYIIHRKFGSLKTNIRFEKLNELREFVVKLAERCGRYVSYAEPILAGTLSDGSRVSATLAGDVATRGPVFTIRKFGEKPLSPVDQINLRTVSSEIMAYFWYLIEHGASMLITGGTATGKTSLLNSICMFIPPESKIVSIEDTREIRIPHEHWVPGLARIGFGIPMPTGEKYGDVTLFDLLRESFRQNPDYVIVGETRGKEAYVMFQGMASGHVCLSTFHAGSLDTVIKRLTTAPIDLSPTLIESLDIIVIMIHAREKGKAARRVKEIVETEAVDPKTKDVKTKTIFLWNPTSDGFERIEDSIRLKKVVAARGGKLEDALADIERRRKILEWLRENKINDYIEVTKYINLYYKEPEKILKMIEGKLEKPMPVEVEIKETKKPKKYSSILELLGFKILKGR